MGKVYDIIIIGGGPSGLTAGLYTSRAGMNTLLLEKMACGGQILITDTIENFPGFPEGIKGPDLAEWMYKQAAHFGLKVKLTEVKSIIPKEKESGSFTVKMSEGPEEEALALIVATGARWNPLGVNGEKELTGRGVSYCATCDGPLFKGKDVVVIGGGDTAIEDALFLTKFAGKVTVVHRRDRLRATKVLRDRALANKKIALCLNSVCSGIVGTDKVEGVRVKDVLTSAEKVIPAQGIFVLIGTTPNSDIVKNLLKVDEKGCIVCDDDMRTSLDGVFACGDVRRKLLRQIVTAAGDGATAAFSAQHYVERLKGVEYK